MTKELFDARQTIQSSQIEGGSAPKKWRSERIFSASKECPFCGTTFRPWMKKSETGKVTSAQQERLWNKQIFCSVKCAKRAHPTSLDRQARLKISKTLKAIKHMPIKRGGNGQLLPLPHLALLHALGIGWEAELSVPTMMGHRNGLYPNHYKIDIANKTSMIAIELDGGSHTSADRQDQDRRKMEFLASQGWRVYRVSNQKALDLYSTFKSVDILLTSLME